MGTAHGSVRTRSCHNSQSPAGSICLSHAVWHHQTSKRRLNSILHQSDLESILTIMDRAHTDPARWASKASLSSLSERAPRTLLLMVDGASSPCKGCCLDYQGKMRGDRSSGASALQPELNSGTHSLKFTGDTASYQGGLRSR